MRGIYIGRFQPFHLGHLNAIKEAMETVDDLVIGIGSSQHYGSQENPFTAGERIEMIMNSLPEDWGKFVFVQIPDTNDFSAWIESVKRMSPHFDVLFTYSKLTENLALEKGMQVKRLSPWKRDRFNGSHIRLLMVEGERWKDSVPDGTKKVIEKVQGIKRVRHAFQNKMADIENIEEAFSDCFKKSGLTLAVAESCTGGLLAKRITDISGSSDFFKGGVVSYTNEAKVKFLGVSEESLKKVGAVSQEVAEQMAKGAKKEFGSDVGVGITGIAGPTGGTKEKPVGTVYYHISYENEETVRLSLDGTRKRVRFSTTDEVMKHLLKKL